MYTDFSHAEAMGLADVVMVLVMSHQATGTSPTLSVDVETSPDGINWASWLGGTVINAQALSTSALTFLASNPVYFQNGARFMRLKLTLAGTGPSSRLNVYWIGRDFYTP